MSILENVQVNISRDSPWIKASIDGGEVTSVSSGSATSAGDTNPPMPPNGWTTYNWLFRYKLSPTGDWKGVVHKLFSGNASSQTGSQTGSLDVCLFRELDEIMWEYGDAEIPFQIWRATGFLTADWVLVASGTMRWDNSRQDYPTHNLIADNDSWWLRVKLTDADHPHLAKSAEATLADRPLIIGDQGQFATADVFHARIKRAAGTTSNAFSGTTYMAYYYPDSGVVNVPISRWFGGSPAVGDAVHFLLESSGPTKDFVIAGGSVTFVKSLSRENEGTFCEHDEYFSIKLANDEGGVSPATVKSQELSPLPSYGVTENRFLGMYDFQCQWLARTEGDEDGPWASIPTHAVQYIPTIGGLEVFLFDYLRVGAIAGDKWNFRVKQNSTSGYVESVTLTSCGQGYASPPVVSFGPPRLGAAKASASIQAVVASVSVTNGGSGYTSVPTVKISGGGGTNATAAAVVSDGSVSGVTLLSAGSGYTSQPTVTISGGGGSGASATAALNGTVTAVSLESGGFGYDGNFSVIFSDTEPASAFASVSDGKVSGLSILSGGVGYATPPTVTISGGGGSGAKAEASVQNGKVSSLSVAAAGSGYTDPPDVLISPPYGGGFGAAAGAEVAYSYILEGVLEYDPDCVPPDTTNPTTTLFDVTAKRSTQRLRFRVRNYSPDPANAEITSAVAGASPGLVAGITGVFVFRYRIDDSPVWKDWEAHFDSETGVLDVSVGELISQAVDSIEYRIVPGASS